MGPTAPKTKHYYSLSLLLLYPKKGMPAQHVLGNGVINYFYIRKRKATERQSVRPEVTALVGFPFCVTVQKGRPLIAKGVASSSRR